MGWDDFNLNLSVSEEETIKWSNRYSYVRGSIDDFGYIMSRSKVKRVGQVYVGICPFPHHNEKTGSFTVYPKGYVRNGKVQDYVSFYCFGCGEGGDVIKFKQLYDQLDTKKDACKIIEKEHNLNINDEDIRQILLKETLEAVKKSSLQCLTFKDINLICSKICKEHLKWTRNNFEDNIFENEFNTVQKFLKYFDNEIIEMTMEEASSLIDITQDFVLNRINELNKL